MFLQVIDTKVFTLICGVKCIVPKISKILDKVHIRVYNKHGEFDEMLR